MSKSTKESALKRIADLKIELPGGQAGIAFEYFLERPDQDVQHDDIVPWIIGMYQQRFGKFCRDPDRAIRKLHDMGLLIKVAKGVYRFEPEAISANVLDDFDENMKNEVKARDSWKCVYCGLGESNGVELQVDHITPRSKGGRAELDNAQTLCGAHNYRKNKLGQLELGERMFVRLKKNAQSTQSENPESEKVIQFCDEVLALYKRYGLDN